MIILQQSLCAKWLAVVQTTVEAYMLVATLATAAVVLSTMIYSLEASNMTTDIVNINIIIRISQCKVPSFMMPAQVSESYFNHTYV